MFNTWCIYEVYYKYTTYISNVQKRFVTNHEIEQLGITRVSFRYNKGEGIP